MKTLRFFWWAMMHHPDFKYCYIKMPISFGVRRSHSKQTTYLSFQVTFQPLSVYIPYSVRDSYESANGLKPDFDDIPF